MQQHSSLVEIKVDKRYKPGTVKSQKGKLRISTEAMKFIEVPVLESLKDYPKSVFNEYLSMQLNPPIIIRGKFADELKRTGFIND